MKTWKLEEAQQCLGEVIRRTGRCGPQRVSGPDGEAVVLSAHDFERLLADAGTPESDLCGFEDIPEAEPVSFLEMMQKSPLAEAMRTGEWPWDWDDATRSWVLPGDVSCGPQRVTGPHGDVVVLSAAEFDRLVDDRDFLEEGDAGGEPTMSFVEFMRTSPLAEAMAAGEFTPEEWDRACRIGR